MNENDTSSGAAAAVVVLFDFNFHHFSAARLVRHFVCGLPCAHCVHATTDTK